MAHLFDTMKAAKRACRVIGLAAMAASIPALAHAEKIENPVAVFSGLDKITGRIGEIESVVTQVAAAIEEQEAATREISRNAEQVSEATNRVSSNMEGVRDSADRTGQASGDVLETAEGLSRQAENMKRRVGEFLSGIKAA